MTTHSTNFLDAQKKKYFTGFDSLRFVAASAVVFCHIELVRHYRGMNSPVPLHWIYETGKLAVKEDAVESVLAKSLSMLEVYSTGPELWLLDWAVNMIVPVCPGDKDG